MAELYAAITEKIGSALEWALGWIPGVWDSIVGFFRGAVNVIDGILSWFGSLPEKFSVWFGMSKTSAIDALNGLINWLKGLPGKILGAIGDFGKLLWNAGKSLLEGLWNGILSAANWIKNKIFGFFGSLIPGWVKDILGIGSPSRVMALEVGRWIPAGVAQGMDSQADMLRQASDRMIDNVTPTIHTPTTSTDTTSGVRVWPTQPTTTAPVIQISSDGTRYSELLVSEISKAVRERGGIVQNVLGNPRITAGVA
jgi:phage-related protein